jgi:hypothetical protein
VCGVLVVWLNVQIDNDFVPNSVQKGGIFVYRGVYYVLHLAVVLFFFGV